MFKFNFDLEEGASVVEDTVASASKNTQTSVDASGSAKKNQDVGIKAFVEIALKDLLSALPNVISYSPLAIPLSNGEELAFARRDLFDARFQLISRDTNDAQEPSKDSKVAPTDLEFLEAPSDLVPGVYEGGLKTWECSLDLVACLHNIYEVEGRVLNGQRILELGCGTAIPSLYLLHRVFCSSASPENGVHIHLQDYNDLVFRLVTITNIILVWYMSPASSSYRASEPASSPDQDAEPLPPPDPSQPGDLSLTSELQSAFLESLKEYGVHIRFFSGSWETFDVSSIGGRYDVVLTSETIYRMDSLPSLVDLMRRTCIGGPEEDETLAIMSEKKLSLAAEAMATNLVTEPSYLCLVAAKLVYFGVGGGVAEFIRAIEFCTRDRGKGVVQTIWEKKEGVKRSVMKVVWYQ